MVFHYAWFFLAVRLHREPSLTIHVMPSLANYLLRNCQTKTSEEAASAQPLLSVTSAPIASAVKTVAAQISAVHPNWELNERRLTKFVKKELASSTGTAAASSSSAAMTDAAAAAKGKKIKFTSPIARLKKKKKAKEEMLASAIKEAAPDGGGAGDPASPVKMADLATPVKEGAGEAADGPYTDDNEAESEPICASCVIC